MMTRHWISNECLSEFVVYMAALGLDWFVCFRSRSRLQVLVTVRAEPGSTSAWFPHEYYPGGVARCTFLASDDAIMPIEIECAEARP